MANRKNIPVPSISSMAQSVLMYFREPHQVLEFTAEGRQHFDAYCACFTTQQSVLRDADDPGAPRQGTAAWHLAVLAAAHLIWEVATGEVRGARKVGMDVLWGDLFIAMGREAEVGAMTNYRFRHASVV